MSARRKPSWSTPRNSVKTNISTVYAEPEQSLPTISAQHVIIAAHDTLSLYSNDSRRPTPRPSIASLRIPSPEPLQEMDELDQSITPQSHDPQDVHTPTTPTLTGEPSTTTLQVHQIPQLPIQSPPSLVRKSWFGTLRRSNQKMEPQHQPAVDLNEVTIHHTSTTPPSPVKNAVSTAPEPMPSSVSTTVVQPSLLSSIDGQAPIIDITTPPPPPVVVPGSNEIKPSLLNTSANRFTLNIPLLGRPKKPLDNGLETKNKDRIDDSLLPVTVLPEVDLSSPQSVTRNHVIEAAVLSDLPPQESTAQDQSFPLEEESASLTSDPSDIESTTQSTETQAQMVANYTWWSYIGWSSIPANSSNTNTASIHVPTDLRHSPAINPNPLLSISTQSSAPVENNSPVEASPNSVVNATASGVSRAPDNQCHTNDANKVISSGSTETTIVNSDNLNVNMSSNASETNTSQPLPSEGKADSVLEEREQLLVSAEQQPNAVNTTAAPASWFSPWSWYSQTHDQTHTENVTQDDGKQEGNDNAIVDADGGKKEEPAGPRSNGNENSNINERECRAGMEDEAQMQHHDTEADAPVVSDDPNPIQQSISANRSGWASFFSSRTLFVKTIGYGSVDEDTTKRDENGMEIMDIDFDDDSNAATASAATGSSMDATTSGTGTETETMGNKGKVKEITNGKTTQDQTTVPPLSSNEKIKKETVKSNPANQIGIKKPQSNKSVSGTSTPVPGASTPTSTPTSKQGSVPASPNGKSPTTNVSTGEKKRTASPAPSLQSKKNAIPPPPNLVLPTWEDTFCISPRSDILPDWVKSMRVGRDQQSCSTTGGKLLGKTMKFVSGVLFSKEGDHGKEVVNDQREQLSPAEKERRERFLQSGKALPRAWDVVQGHFGTETSGHSLKRGLGLSQQKDGGTDRSGLSNRVHDVLQGCRRVVVIGIHGWFPGAVVRTMLGEPTGTSSKFVSMMIQALHNFEREHGVTLDKITPIPLEGEGTIEKRVERLYRNLNENQEWMDDLHAADAIFVATHSQGSVVSTHLLDRLMRDRHIRTAKNSEVLSPATSFPASAGMTFAPAPRPQKVCCLALCGIHLGPLRYLRSSSLLQPYFQYFESSAARELFEFQNTESAVSKSYVKALSHVVDNGAKMVYVASLNDQVVPIYSGLFTSVSHPLILRALYIDGDAYHSSDFLSNLLVLLLRIRNAGINDSGLLAHLSEATAGSLNGVGHSTAYEELATYSLAVKYLFLTNDGFENHPDLTLELFNANHEQNDYEIPWALRDVIADESVTHYFATEIAELRDAFRDWHPKTTILRDLKRKLQPIQRLPSSFSSRGSTSKL